MHFVGSVVCKVQQIILISTLISNDSIFKEDEIYWIYVCGDVKWFNGRLW